MRKRQVLPCLFLLVFSACARAQEASVDVVKLLTPPTAQEIEQAFQSFPKAFSCEDFQTGKVEFDSDEMEALSISYKSDGLKIYGMLARPKKPGKYPLFMYNHGGFSGIMSIDRTVLFELADRGYVVLASAYRGEPGPGGKSDGYVELGHGEVVDILNLMECGKKLPGVDADKIVMMGGSHGGLNTLLSLSLSKDIKVAVDFVGPTNLFNAHFGSMFEDALENYMKTGKFDILGSEISPELRDKFTNALKDEKAVPFLRKEMVQRSPLYFARHINAPVLMIYGGQDPLVPIKNAYELEEAFKKHKKIYELKVYEKAGHGFIGAQQAEIEEMMFSFIEKHLK